MNRTQKNFNLFLLILLLGIQFVMGQQLIELPINGNTEIHWNGDAKTYFSSDWNTQVVTNVSRPSMQVFLPDPSIANGSSVIIAPGGGLFALAIEKEGNLVAQWLTARGITAFVLKYRLLPTADDGVKEVMQDWENVFEKVTPILPLSIDDGRNAVTYVRENATKWNLEPNKIGLMGFSAGGALTMGVAFNSNAENRPDFIVPVYPWMTVVGEYEVPEETPPMFLVCATDDELLLAAESVKLYSEWTQNGGSSEMHMYARGGHGFGMDQKGLPSDNWISQFYEWALSEELVKSRSPQ